jgi:succinyl-diaminopimelate desuccinylase
MTTARATQFRELLSDLVAIETENPPGNEGPCSEYVVGWFRDRGVSAHLVEEPYPHRPQAVARVGDGSPTLVLNGHTDVVPADPDEWDHDPYDPTVEDGLLYGRGSTDMKAGLALAMVVTVGLEESIESGELGGSIVVHAAIGEETAEPGTRALLEAGYDGDYGVVLEPTEFRVATSEKGLAWYEITVAGDPSHASRPDQGSNAVHNAEPVLDALAAYDRRVRERTDDLVGRAYATVTEFAAGVDTNKGVIPGGARISLDRRFLPGESAPEIDRELDEVLAAVEAEPGVETTWERTQTYESAAVPVDCHLASVLRDHAKAVAGVPTDPIGTKASSDVRNLIHDAGMEAVVWGPGSNDQAHVRDEFLDVDRAAVGLEILDRAVRQLLG